MGGKITASHTHFRVIIAEIGPSACPGSSDGLVRRLFRVDRDRRHELIRFSCRMVPVEGKGKAWAVPSQETAARRQEGVRRNGLGIRSCLPRWTRYPSADRGAMSQSMAVGGYRWVALPGRSGTWRPPSISTSPHAVPSTRALRQTVSVRGKVAEPLFSGSLKPSRSNGLARLSTNRQSLHRTQKSCFRG